MSATNITGPIYQTRQGAITVTHSKRFTTGTSTTGATTGITVRATPVKPVVVEAMVAVTTGDAGTSPTVSVGYTSTGYADLVNAASTATGTAGGTFLPSTLTRTILTSDQEIFYKQGGTPSGSTFWLILRIFDLNTAP
jgi:hypothetical protein